ncbi:tyrosine-type recombinase/integrase [Halalkalicoccus subterraneus]|uniref:tyrosine-type recombinase/integrase n=1 Tax=Halalkalicoccus subterraneus TaxID=2675002 RepID=UPI000EFB9999|nr:site-specific integrase [Halalkalicoccus subterraneus]
MHPTEAVQDYLDGRTDLCQSSKANHRYRLQRFKEWCEEEGITNTNELTGRKLHQFKIWRSQEVNNVTLKNHLGTLRQFIAFCERIDAVAGGLSEKLELPQLGYNEEVNDTMLSHKEAKRILPYLKKYEYGSVRHVIFVVLWHTGIRISTLRAFDVEDFDSQQGFLRAIHRPETPLKNRKQGEREINLNDETVEIIEDYLRMTHSGVTDTKGRTPLIATSQGRAHTTTIRAQIYRVTRPCHYLNSCPHDRDVNECEAVSNQYASKCPSSVSPHAIRKGAITHHRNNGWPAKAVSDRADVSQEVLDKHYDKGTQSEKRERRKEFMNNL